MFKFNRITPGVSVFGASCHIFYAQLFLNVFYFCCQKDEFYVLFGTFLLFHEFGTKGHLFSFSLSLWEIKA